MEGMVVGVAAPAPQSIRQDWAKEIMLRGSAPTPCACQAALQL